MANYCICRINKIHLSFFEKKVNKLYKKRYFSDLFFQKKRRRGEMGPNNKEYNMCYVCIGMLKGDYFFWGGGLSTKSKYLLIIMFLEFYFTHHKIMNSQRRLWPKYIGFICSIYQDQVFMDKTSSNGRLIKFSLVKLLGLLGLPQWSQAMLLLFLAC